MPSTVLLSPARKRIFLILTWLFFGIGSWLSISSDYRAVGFIVFFAGLIIVPTHLGISFDRDKNQYRFYRSWAGLEFGSWEELPKIQHIVVKYFAYNSTSTTEFGQVSTENIKEYVLMLSVANSVEGIIISRYQGNPEALEEARLTAASLANVLNIDVQVFSLNSADTNTIVIS